MLRANLRLAVSERGVMRMPTPLNDDAQQKTTARMRIASIVYGDLCFASFFFGFETCRQLPREIGEGCVRGLSALHTKALWRFVAS
jgi:hypothetical protein